MPVKNLDRLNKKLTRLSQGAIEMIRPELAKAADDMVVMAKRFAPVDEGELRDSIGWVWGSEIPKGAVKLGTVRGGSRRDPNLIITVFAGNEKVFWARWQEFGTTRHKSHPYFFPAYRAQRKSIKSRIRRAVSKAAKAEAAK